MLGKFTFLFDYAHRVPVLGSSRIPVRFHLWVRWRSRRWPPSASTGLARPGAVRLRCAPSLVAVLVVASIPILLFVYSPVWTEPRRWTHPYTWPAIRWLGRRAESRRLATRSSSSWRLAWRGGGRACGRAPSAPAWLLPLRSWCRPLGATATTCRRSLPTTGPCRRRVQLLKADPGLSESSGSPSSVWRAGLRLGADRFPAGARPLDWSLPPVGDWPRRGARPRSSPRRMLDYFEQHVMARAGSTSSGSATSSRAANMGTALPAQRAGGLGFIHRTPGSAAGRLMGRPVYADGSAEAVAAARAARSGDSATPGRRGPDRPLAAGRRGLGHGEDRRRPPSASRSRPTRRAGVSRPGRHVRPRLVGHGRRPARPIRPA